MSIRTKKRAEVVEEEVLSNAEKFTRDLQARNLAGIGVMLIRTREPFRAQEVIQQFAFGQEATFRAWTCLAGWQTFPLPDTAQPDLDITEPAGGDEGTRQLERAFDAIPAHGDKAISVMMNPHHWFESAPIQQHIKNHVRSAVAVQRRIIMLVPEAVTIPPAIEDDIAIVDFPTPDLSELRTIWDELIGGLDEEMQPAFEEEGVHDIIRNAAGMTHMEFETAISMAAVEYKDALADHSITPADFVKSVLGWKVEIIKRTDILELLPPGNMAEVGGYDLLKEWIKERREIFSERAKAFGIDRPKGMLLVGPPGGGKSKLARAIASEMHVPCIMFNIGRVFGSLVGQTESRTRAALKMIEAMAPCVVLLDEMDKALGGMGGGGDSGVSQRVLGSILTWMQECKKDCFVVATANNVQGLPPELMRKGRLDAIFAITFPGEIERAQIAKIHVELRGHELETKEYRAIAKKTDKWTGAEIEQVIKDALVRAFSTDTGLSLENIQPEIDGTIPLSVSFAEQVGAMQKWAKNNAKPASTEMKFEEETNKPLAEGGPVVRRPLLRRKLMAKPGAEN